MTDSSVDTNPLLEPWTGPFEAPPFERIEPGHFRPAFDAALKDARDEIDAVAANPAPRPSPTRSRPWSAAGVSSIA